MDLEIKQWDIILYYDIDKIKKTNDFPVGKCVECKRV